MKLLLNVKHDGKNFKKGEELKDKNLFELFIKKGFVASDIIEVKKQEPKETKTNETSVELTSNLINAMIKKEIVEVASERNIELKSKRVEAMKEELINKLGL